MLNDGLAQGGIISKGRANLVHTLQFCAAVSVVPFPLTSMFYLVCPGKLVPRGFRGSMFRRAALTRVQTGLRRCYWRVPPDGAIRPRRNACVTASPRRSAPSFDSTEDTWCWTVLGET
jgi:hypothetical protein